MMTALLSGSLDLKSERPELKAPIWMCLNITNDSDKVHVITNPDLGIPPPDLNWRSSLQAYQIGILISFGLIQITLKDAEGASVESKGLMPWVTPILGKRVLQPKESFSIKFDLNELFLINLTGLYNLQVRYGDMESYAEANANVAIQ